MVITFEDTVHRKCFAAVAGLLTHLVLSRGEWDHTTHLLVIGWLVTFLTIVGIKVSLEHASIHDAVHVCTLFAFVYFSTLMSSIVIYRACFHRLRKVCFPPPSNIVKQLTFAVPRPIPRPTFEILLRFPGMEQQLPILQSNRSSPPNLRHRHHPHRTT